MGEIDNLYDDHVTDLGGYRVHIRSSREDNHSPWKVTVTIYNKAGGVQVSEYKKEGGYRLLDEARFNGIQTARGLLVDLI